MSVGQQSDEGGLVRKAVNLFTFLGRTQQLLVKPVRTVDGFEEAVWFSKLPDHAAVRGRHRGTILEPEEPLLEVDRVPRLDAPIVPDQLIEWVGGPFDDVDKQPSLNEEIFTDKPERWRAASDEKESSDDERDPRRVLLSETVGVVEAFDEWLPVWQAWADRERADAVARDIYKELFAIYLKSTDHSEEFELVLASDASRGSPRTTSKFCGTSRPRRSRSHSTKRPGPSTVVQVPSPEAVSIELDMLDPALISSPAKIDEIRQMPRANTRPLARRGRRSATICRRLIHPPRSRREYDDDVPRAADGRQSAGRICAGVDLAPSDQPRPGADLSSTSWLRSHEQAKSRAA